MLKREDVAKIVIYNQYRKSKRGIGTGHKCPICGKSLENSINLIVEDKYGTTYEVHGTCMQ
jgi:hypothetical protein